MLFLSILLFSFHVSSQPWMTQIFPLIKNLSILDLSLPGTHDTMTYDLSTQVSDGGWDDSPFLSEILHKYKDLVPGDWIRMQAQTQTLNITQQLDAGIRFLDFRIMFTSNDWYCLHFLQTNQKSLIYLSQVKAWLDNNPGEIIVIWLSKHGSECKVGNDQYPNVSIQEKRHFWNQIKTLFGSLLFDSSQSSLNATSLQTMMQRGQRTVIYASDYVEFSNSDPLAIDACLIENDGVDNISKENPQMEISLFQHSKTKKSQLKKKNMFYLLSMANSPPMEGLKYAAELYFEPIDKLLHLDLCAKAYNIPAMNSWCPSTLLDVGQLTDYYKQKSLYYAHKAGYEFPNAIYIDAVVENGLLAIGPETQGRFNCDIFEWTDCTDSPNCPSGYYSNGETTHFPVYNNNNNTPIEQGFCFELEKSHHQCCKEQINPYAGYSYVDTLVYSNVFRACPKCHNELAFWESKIQANPLNLWYSPEIGRLIHWPNM